MGDPAKRRATYEDLLAVPGHLVGEIIHGTTVGSNTILQRKGERKRAQELFDRHRDPLSDDFQREKRKLEGVERYLIQLWRDS